jgi:hypothetical protein
VTIESGTCITPANDTEWLAVWQSSLGASEAATARLADGRVLGRKVVSIPEREVKQRAYSYTDLRILRGGDR